MQSEHTQTQTHTRGALHNSLVNLFEEKKKLTEVGFSKTQYVCLCACRTHLELWPVHAHTRPVCVPPPSQVFSVVGHLDGVTQVPVQSFEPIG